MEYYWTCRHPRISFDMIGKTISLISCSVLMDSGQVEGRDSFNPRRKLGIDAG